MEAVVKALLEKFAHREDGATAVEYGIMLALIAAVIFVSVGLLGIDVFEIFSDMAERFP